MNRCGRLTRKVHYEFITTGFQMITGNSDKTHLIQSVLWMEHNSNFNLCIGSVGGYVRYKKGNLIYVFSGPINAPDALSAEIEAILHIVRLILSRQLKYKRISVDQYGQVCWLAGVAVCFYMFKNLKRLLQVVVFPG